jgi:hypothetical protein
MSLKAALQHHSEISDQSTSIRDLQDGFHPLPLESILALTIKMGPFVPERDAFHFVNSFSITEEQVAEIRRRYKLVSDAVIGVCVRQVTARLTSLSVDIPVLGNFGLPGFVVDAVVGDVTARLVGRLIDDLGAQIPGRFGRCGGMAFAGYDFYLLDWPVDARLGTAPPETGALGNYIFERLLDSLDLNVATFVEWVVNLHVMPVISVAANAALGLAVGSIGGPIGAAFGALLGSQIEVFNLGGAGVIFDRTKDEWIRIKAKLATEAAWPIGVIYGDSVVPTDQHQILAIGAIENGDGTARLIVWDNNDGHCQRELLLDFRGDELQVSNSKRPIKGIFLENYSSRQPPDTLRLN